MGAPRRADRRASSLRSRGGLRRAPQSRALVRAAISFARRARENALHAGKTLALVWRSSPPQTLALAVVTIAGGLAPLGVAYAAKRIVDAILAGDAAASTRWVLAELACVAAVASAQRAQELVRTVLGARLGLDVGRAILDKALRLRLACFEDSEFRDRLIRAQSEVTTRPIALVVESFALAENLITLVGYALLVARFSGVAVLLLGLATLPATLAEVRFSRLVFGVHNERSPEARRLLYLEHVLADDRHAKEVKLFDVGRTFLERHRALGERLYAQDRGLHLRRAAWTHALALVGTLAVYATYAAMAAMAASGRLSLGYVTLYVVALRQGQQAFQSVLGGIGRIYEHGLYMSNLWAYLGTDAEEPRPRALATAAACDAPGIVLERVGFRYPGVERWALRDVSLTISPGDSVALVGENGAGKTTLVKLLTRLYEPTEGRILLDGKDVRAYAPEELRRRFGVVFQDFNRYHLTARDNVAVGRDADDASLGRALARAGAKEIVAALPGGLDAELGHYFEGGAELSGGQWQRIALARAFLREDADILVLDEPTAALDAEAEHAVFERFRRLAEGRTTIVISHRFPTARMAKQIVVLEDGGVRERGTHDELVARGGKYARMFALQAEGYR